MDIYDKVRSDAYKTAKPYPQKVMEPALLRKSARDLTDAELAKLPQVRAEYAEALAAEKQVLADYQADQARLEDQFKADLEEAFGMTGHPKAAKLYGKAWEHGHSGGFSEILYAYEDLVDLVKD